MFRYALAAGPEMPLSKEHATNMKVHSKKIRRYEQTSAKIAAWVSALDCLVHETDYHDEIIS
jgi:hypothetical protein